METDGPISCGSGPESYSESYTYGVADSLGLVMRVGTWRRPQSPRCSVIRSESPLSSIVTVSRRRRGYCRGECRPTRNRSRCHPRALRRHSRILPAGLAGVDVSHIRSRTTTRNHRPGGCSTRRRHPLAMPPSVRRHPRDVGGASDRGEVGCRRCVGSHARREAGDVDPTPPTGRRHWLRSLQLASAR